MSAAQKVVLFLGVAVIAGLCAYPPYVTLINVEGRSVGVEHPIGRKLVTEHGLKESIAQFEERHHLDKSENSEYMFVQIAYRQLAVEILIAAVATLLLSAGAWALTRRQRSKVPQ